MKYFLKSDIDYGLELLGNCPIDKTDSFYVYETEIPDAKDTGVDMVAHMTAANALLKKIATISYEDESGELIEETFEGFFAGDVEAQCAEFIASLGYDADWEWFEAVEWETIEA